MVSGWINISMPYSFSNNTETYPKVQRSLMLYAIFLEKFIQSVRSSRKSCWDQPLIELYVRAGSSELIMGRTSRVRIELSVAMFYWRKEVLILEIIFVHGSDFINRQMRVRNMRWYSFMNLENRIKTEIKGTHKCLFYATVYWAELESQYFRMHASVK